ncbi:MAG: flagellar motor switch protein FliN [Myxococcota bacterium]|jgi:flagellar motor switch protein FliN/FliY|nr:flagellar motor switch protein FliN [Myxococcota bacterium]
MSENNPGGIDLILDIPLEISVRLGRARMPIQELMSLSPGSVIDLDKLSGEPLDILLNGKLVARGEAVVVNERYGVRLVEIISASDRISGLGSS